MSQPQEFTFQTEIKQLLHILSHSLYQNREIALRELISNASDSLNKLRHIQLSEEQYRDDQPLEITLEPNKDSKLLVIRDNGIGLTHDELVQNLGTIAHSGSKEFLRTLAAKADGAESSPSADLSLIGQFGVGFYAAFMLADRVEVVTRSYREETGWRWESDGSGRFTITPAEEEVPRGAQIRLHLKDDMDEFTDPMRLKFIVRKYSTFVPHPIKLDGETLNEQKPIWVEPKNQVTEEQHAGFYQWLTHHAEEKPLWHLHLSSDSPIQFHSILYCPPTNFELMGFGQIEHGINLCAKRILVQDDCRDLLPDYLRFLYGVVDSADLPLNVSRETLQDHKLLPKLKRVLIKKVLDHLASIAEEQPETFKTFYQQFGPILRTGIGQDFENRERIAKLMRFHSTHTANPTLVVPGGTTDQPVPPTVSLDSYLQRAVEGQTQIYYLSGPDLDALSRHPLLEAFRKRNLEVLFLDDPIDEFALTQLRRYEGKDLISIDSADVSFPESTDPPETEAAEKPKNITRVIELFRGALESKVQDIRESSRLTESPCCLINPQGTMSNQLQKVLSHTMKEYEAPKRIMEVNPHAALVTRLCDLSSNSENDEFIRDCGRQLYANALILDGLIPDVEETTTRSLRFMEELARSKSSIVL
ncbi:MULTISPECIES: molecular chaperone HtpG [unclassified Schlesneria]|uniref:molecular chaperone HtpG n=1 Tax=Schlesneria TaxID=656899 RepID=UPI002F25E694